MTSLWAWVCKTCAKATDRGGFKTLSSVADAARAHGCFRVTKPTSKREARNLARVQVPRFLTIEAWRTVWDSLDAPPSVETAKCRSVRGLCGHVEPSHLFSSVTQPFCRTDRGGNPGNCTRCP